MATLSLVQATDILRRTPGVLMALMFKLDPIWLEARERDGAWSPKEVLGHLIYGECGDWINRVEIILNEGPERPFPPFDLEASKAVVGSSGLETLLDQFQSLRVANLRHLEELKLTSQQLVLTGIHPDLGRVTLEQLIASWAAHDLSHVTQIFRTLTRSTRNSVGPWVELMPILENPL